MRYLLISLCLFIFSACQDDDDLIQFPTPPTGIPAFTYLALGDSYTIGTAVAPTERWPRQLLNRLAGNGVALGNSDSVSLDVVAVNGWTTSDLLGGIEQRRSGLRREYDLVSLLIGVNNQYRGQALDVYRQEFEELLQTAITLAGDRPGRVFVVSIPDYSYTPFGNDNRQISEELVRFNAAAKLIAEDYNVVFLNITPISEEAGDLPELVATDGLHPSGLQYERWVEEVILDRVRELLD